MKKKLVSVLLSAVMVMALATACGKKEAEESTVDETVTEGTETEEVVDAEAIPEAKYYWSFDGAEEGYTVKENDFTSVEATTVDTRIIDSSKELLFTDGVAGQCVYLDGTYGLEMDVEPVGETYTISFWMNAARFSDFGPVIQFGQDLYSANLAARWVNFTKTTFPSEDTFPIIWSRDEAKDIFPWFDAEDNVVYGKKEWVNIVLVADETKMTEDGLFIAADIYINGVSIDKENQLTPGCFAGTDNFKFYIGINCWDSIYKGAIDELYIFDQALTAGQVTSLYQAGDPTVELVAPDAGAESEADVVAARTDVVADASALEVIGTPDCTLAFWSEFSNSVELKEGESKTVVFNNYSDGVANWDNYVVALTNTATTSDLAPSPDNYAGYAEYAVIRADLFGWGDAAYAGVFEGSWGEDFEAFASAMMNAKVSLTLTRSNSDVTLDAVITAVDGTEYTSSSVITSSLTSDAPLYFFLTGEKVYVEILSVK